jgi:2-polyprenyl-3-methyl-5-hydroxy-6-metoxy-1,4-benzoquinol methylase
VSFATIEDLRSQLGASTPPRSPAYIAKMMHAIPQTTEVDRAKFILERVKGKRVLEFGASGPMHEAIVQVAAFVVGVDRHDGEGVIGCNLDDVTYRGLPYTGDRPDVIVCGEVLEHLGNPQWFLTRLSNEYPGIPVIVTVPNAFSKIARAHLTQGIENVNIDHVAWFSWRTLTTLVRRAGFTVDECYWYGGDGPTAQGIVMVMHG